MGIKEKTIGILLILLGAWPFLLKIEKIGTFFAQYKFLEILTPGEIVFQIVLVLLGILLIFRRKKVIEARPIQ